MWGHFLLKAVVSLWRLPLSLREQVFIPSNSIKRSYRFHGGIFYSSESSEHLKPHTKGLKKSYSKNLNDRTALKKSHTAEYKL